jgi:hypothetical protein
MRGSLLPYLSINTLMEIRVVRRGSGSVIGRCVTLRPSPVARFFYDAKQTEVT